jgi:8-oxo-dGTP diphosphatase
MTNVRPRGVALVVKDDSLLLVEHRDRNGRFLSPPGGGVERQESVEQATIREVKEETGLDVQLTELVMLRQFREPELFRVTYEHFFLAKLVSASPASVSRTMSEEMSLGALHWVSINDLGSANIRVLPEFLADVATVRRLLDSQGAMWRAESSEPPGAALADAPFPADLRQQYPEYFLSSPRELRAPSSFSGACPFLAKATGLPPLVLRPCGADEGRWLLRLTKWLIRESAAEFGARRYALLTGKTETEPWTGDGTAAFLVQEFCDDHNPDVVQSLRDIDIHALGQFCGRLQTVLDRVPPDTHPSPVGSHPLAMSLPYRLAHAEQRMSETNIGDCPAEYADWVCEETHRTIDALRRLGAPQFPETLIDRDLNLRNATISFGSDGLATIGRIFDPDFVVGCAADALRNPGLAFASASARSTLEEILDNDSNTVASPRWMLYMRGFLRAYPLSAEEILAIPLLEKFEILTYRLYEQHERYRVPTPFITRFREYTRVVLARIDNLEWSARLSALMESRPSSVFLPSLHAVRRLSATVPECTRASVHAKARTALRSVGARLDSFDNRQVLPLDSEWTALVEPRPGVSTVTLQEGFPFPLTRTPLHGTPELPANGCAVTLYLHGEGLRRRQREEALAVIQQAFPDECVEFLETDRREIQCATAGLSLHRRRTAFVLDPFRYFGDSSYIGLYVGALRHLNPFCDFTVLSQNRSIWELFDCKIARRIDEIPDDLGVAVLPAPIDDQWGAVLALLPPLLRRTNLAIVPNRDLVVRRVPAARRIEILHSGQPDTALAHENISHYTWHGLERLLPEPVSLVTASDAMLPKRRTVSRPSAGRYRVLINPTTSNSLKDLSPGLCDGIVGCLETHFGKDLALWVSAGDPRREHDRAIADQLKNAHPHIDLLREDLGSFTSWMTSMDLVVTADTSISHLAGHKGVPSAVLWNLQRWNAESALDMVHNGPIGFSHGSPLSLDLYFDRSEGEETRSTNDTIERFGLGLRWFDVVRRQTPADANEAFFSGPVDVVRLLQDAEELERALYDTGRRTVFDAARATGTAFAMGRRLSELRSRLRPDWTPLLDPKPVPFGLAWLVDLMSTEGSPESGDALSRLRFVHAAWYRSAVRKTIMHARRDLGNCST